MWQTTRVPRPTPSCASRGPTASSRTTGTSTGRAAARRPPPCRACSGRSASTRRPRSGSTWPSPTSRTCRGAACCRRCSSSGRVGRRTCRCTSRTRTPSRCGSSWTPRSAAVGARSRRPTCRSSRGRSTGGWSGARRSRCRRTCRSAGTRSSRRARAPARTAPWSSRRPTWSCPRPCGSAGRGGSWPSSTRCGRAASWGVGDLADLAEIGWLAGRELDADFLLINPLHAAEPTVPLTPSPYLPTTRRFVNPLYIRVEDVREAGYLSSADRTLVEWASEPVLATDDDAGPIDRDAAWTAKRAALEVVFAAPRSAARQAAFDAFVDQEGFGLETFALWCALAEKYADVTPWPAEALDPSSALVAELRLELAERVEFHLWLQWVADEQLAARPARRARRRAWRSGIMHDLAVGVHPQGADVWALGDVLARGATVGRAAGHVQPAGAELVAAAVAPGRPGAGRVQAVPGHAAHRAPARRRHPDRPRHRAVPAVVDPRGRRLRRRCVRPVRPRGARRHPGARGAPGRRRRHRRGPRRRRAVGAGLPVRARDPRHLGAVVRARHARRAAGSRALPPARAWPR